MQLEQLFWNTHLAGLCSFIILWLLEILSTSLFTSSIADWDILFSKEVWLYISLKIVKQILHACVTPRGTKTVKNLGSSHNKLNPTSKSYKVHYVSNQCCILTKGLCMNYCIPGNFCGMYISRLSNQSGFSWMKFHRNFTVHSNDSNQLDTSRCCHLYLLFTSC